MNGRVLTPEEEVQLALNTLNKHGVSRGDSFDIGTDVEEYGGGGSDMLTKLISNPKGLIGNLDVTPKQAENIRSVIVGGGTGLAHKYLSRTFGDEIAGGIGGFISGWIAKKLVGR